MSKEFDYEIAAFHHAVEAYKVADILAENNVCGGGSGQTGGALSKRLMTWCVENAALVDMAGACAIIHSDDEIQIQTSKPRSSKGDQRIKQDGLPR